MKWTLLIIFSLVVVCSTDKAKKKKKNCGPPSYGSIVRDRRNGTVSYSCDEGFELVGKRETVCDTSARKKNRVAVCFPIYVGKVNCTALDSCPDDLNYLKKFDIGRIDEELDIQAQNATAELETAKLIGRSFGSNACLSICKGGTRVCQALRKKRGRRYRKAAKECWNCYTSHSCPVIFWG